MKAIKVFVEKFSKLSELLAFFITFSKDNVQMNNVDR